MPKDVILEKDPFFLLGSRVVKGPNVQHHPGPHRGVSFETQDDVSQSTKTGQRFAYLKIYPLVL